jgi:parallel beta-helix repeat protein
LKSTIHTVPRPFFVGRGTRRAAMLAFGFAVAAAGLLFLMTDRADAAETCAGSNCDTVAFVDGGALYSLYSDPVTTSAVRRFYFGNPQDEALMGDWNCDGEATPAMYRRSAGLMYLRNSNTQGNADMQFYFGNPGDIPIAGDFNGDGCDTVSIYRPLNQRFYITNHLGNGNAEYEFTFGNPGDLPFVGDFNGDGVDTVGVHRRTTGQVFITDAKTGRSGNRSFVFGDAGDQVIAGDWDGNGTDTVAAYRQRNGVLYLKNSNATGAADSSASVGFFETVNTARGIPNFNTSTTPSGTIDVEVYPGDDLESLARSHGDGTVFRIHGTLYGQEIRPRTGQVFIGAPGAILKGNGADRAFWSTANNVRVEGLEVTDYDSGPQDGAVQAGGSGWIVRGNHVHHNAAVGIKMYKASNSRVEGNNVHHNAQLGISVAYATGTIVENNEIAYNNWQNEFSWGFEAGGTKFWSTTGLVVRSNWSHHNRGPGLWTDTDNISTTYEGNVIEDNYSVGILHEVSYSVTIRNNTIRRNGFGHDAWLWGGGIVLSTSRDANVYGNTLTGNYNGITMVQQSRGTGKYGSHIVKNNVIHDNLIIDSGTSGAAEDISDKSIFSAGNTFQGNDYRGNVGWEWGGGRKSWSSWRNYGLDSSGSYVS